MANLFLGFPVPRAKIADMITGTAPPSLHKTQHQDGGTDELDCTGLVGAGGISLPLNDFYVDTMWESLDGWTASAGSNGEYGISGTCVSIASGPTAGGWAEIEKEITYPFPALSWSKKRQFLCSLQMQANTSHAGNIMIAMGGIVSGGQYVGFWMDTGKLYAVYRYSSLHSQLVLDVSGAPYDITKTLKAIHTPGVDIKFYIDGVLVHTATTDLPTGTSKATKILEWLVDNANTDELKYSRMSRFQFHQEA